MAKEVEYKFIWEGPIPTKWFNAKLLQGYIHIDKKKQVRVRIDLNNHMAQMCIKFMDGNIRDEFEVKMDFNEGLHLYALCPYKVEKTRYSELWGQYEFAIDLYTNGTAIIEVEDKYNDREFKIDDLPDHIKDHLGRNVDGVYEYCNYHFAGFPKSEYK